MEATWLHRCRTSGEPMSDSDMRPAMTQHVSCSREGARLLTPWLPLCSFPTTINPFLFQITCQRGQTPHARPVPQTLPLPARTQQSPGPRPVGATGGTPNLGSATWVGRVGVVCGWGWRVCWRNSQWKNICCSSLNKKRPSPHRHTPPLPMPLCPCHFPPLPSYAHWERVGGRWELDTPHVKPGAPHTHNCVWLWLKVETLYTIRTLA